MSSRRAQGKNFNQKFVNSSSQIDYSRELLLLVTRYVPEYVGNVYLKSDFENQTLPPPKNAGGHTPIFVRNLLYVDKIPYKVFMRMLELNCKLPRYAIFHVQFVCSVLQIWSHKRYEKQIQDTIVFFPLHAANTYIYPIRVQNMWRLVEDPVYFEHQMSEMQSSMPKVIFTILQNSKMSLEKAVGLSKTQSLLRFAVKVQYWAHLKTLANSAKTEFITDQAKSYSDELVVFCKTEMDQNSNASREYAFPDPDSLENEFENLLQLVSGFKPISDNTAASQDAESNVSSSTTKLPVQPSNDTSAPVATPRTTARPIGEQEITAIAKPLQATTTKQLSPMDIDKATNVQTTLPAPIKVLKSTKSGRITKRSASANMPLPKRIVEPHIAQSQSSETISAPVQATQPVVTPAPQATLLKTALNISSASLPVTVVNPVEIATKPVKKSLRTAIWVPSQAKTPIAALPQVPTQLQKLPGATLTAPVEVPTVLTNSIVPDIRISLVFGDTTSVQNYPSTYTINDVVMDELGIVNLQHHIITFQHRKYNPLKDNRVLQLHDVICIYPSGKSPDINIHMTLLNGASFRTMLPPSATLAYLFGATRSEFATSLSCWKYKRIAPGKKLPWIPLTFSDTSRIFVEDGLRIMECPSESA